MTNRSIKFLPKVLFSPRTITINTCQCTITFSLLSAYIAVLSSFTCFKGLVHSRINISCKNLENFSSKTFISFQLKKRKPWTSWMTLGWEHYQEMLCVGGKTHVFGRVLLEQFTFKGRNIMLLGSLQPVDMKINPRQQR